MKDSSPMAIAAASKNFQDSPIRSTHAQESKDLEQRLEEARINRKEQERESVPPVPVDAQETGLKSREDETQVKEAPVAPRVSTPESAPTNSLTSSKWSPASKFHAAVGQIKAFRRNSAQSPTRLPEKKARSPTRQAEVVPTVAPSKHRDSADSTSSFRRARAAPPSSGGRITLRSSLRSDDRRPTSPPREISPNESLSNQPRPMRTSLRGSTSPNRREAQRPKPNRISSLLKTSKTKAGKMTSSVAGITHSKVASRYSHDSDSDSDTEVPIRTAFTSRYAADSDDEDVPVSPSSLKAVVFTQPSASVPPTTPHVRGIPRSADEDNASTDLEGEELDSEQPSPIPLVPTIEAINRAHVPATQPKTPPKGLEASRFASQSPSPRSGHRRWHSVLLFGSSSSPNAARSTSVAGAGAPTRPGKLRRRSKHGDMPSWPLKDAVEAHARPISSDGVTRKSSTRVDMGKRRSTADDVLGLKVKDMMTADGDGSTVVGEEGAQQQPVTTEEPKQEKEVALKDVQMKAEKKKRFGKWKNLIKF
jgi:hypothetical protein